MQRKGWMNHRGRQYANAKAVEKWNTYTHSRHMSRFTGLEVMSSGGVQDPNELLLVPEENRDRDEVMWNWSSLWGDFAVWRTTSEGRTRS